MADGLPQTGSSNALRVAESAFFGEGPALPRRAQSLLGRVAKWPGISTSPFGMGNGLRLDSGLPFNK